MNPHTSSLWPLLTLLARVLVVVVAAAIVPLVGHINPNPFSFTTDNIFWLAANWLTAAVLTVVAGASGLGVRRHADLLRTIAAIAIAIELLIVLIMVIVQAIGGARPELLAASVLRLVALLLASVTVVLAFLVSRGSAGQSLPLLGLGAVTLAALVAELAAIVDSWVPAGSSLFLYDAENLVLAACTVVGVWLAMRLTRAAVWAGAGVLAVLALVLVWSTIRNPSYNVPAAVISVYVIESLLAIAAVVTAILAAMATKPGRVPSNPA
ncbi:hypothetical protein GCM10011575_41140 [Microlunatus endophyticus]|uniref:Uncharacterized protein n=1 Tax=Microlunatus endophyticus TaxID=1716077 RepID=A0A917SFB2_9ACTN|nr:hypothetical protein [Microlunatus endophyticus]GGL78557.1 hypothetical protein GCM10011575_41140 [Microlunatus endophyticus]